MSGDVLGRLARLEAEATTGPWVVDEPMGWRDPSRQFVCMAPIGSGYRDMLSARTEDAEFIAALRNAAPVLLDIAQAAERLLPEGAPKGVTLRQRAADLRTALSWLDEVDT